MTREVERAASSLNIFCPCEDSRAVQAVNAEQAGVARIAFNPAGFDLVKCHFTDTDAVDVVLRSISSMNQRSDGGKHIFSKYIEEDITFFFTSLLTN